MGRESLTTTSRAGSPRRQRRMRNLLLDRQFQLKYSAYLVSIALFLSVSLGYILWRTGHSLVERSRDSVSLGEGIVERGQQLLAESDKVSRVVRMNIADAYGGDPALMDVFQAEAQKHDAMLADSQQELERNTRALRAQALRIEREYLFFSYVIGGALVLLVVGVGLAGVVVTHRVAGPIFKMKRLLGALAKGHFRVVARLRKGDELRDFFQAFNQAAQELSARQEEEIQEINAVIDLLQRDQDGERLEKARKRLMELRNAMKISLTTTPPFD